MESGSSEHRKKSKEQEQQKRRVIQGTHGFSSKAGPLFGEPTEKNDGDPKIKNILGSYQDFLVVDDQKKCFGVTNNTPSTPLPPHSKHVNPFDSNLLASSSTTSQTGASSSRHPVAQLPSGQSLSSTKKDKNRQSSKLAKSESRTSGAADKLLESKPIPAQPTNILRVKNPSIKAAVKPYKATGSQKKTSPNKTSKSKMKKSHSAQVLAPFQLPSSDNSTNSSVSSSHKTKKSSLQPDPLSSHGSQATGTPSMKRVSSAGTISVKTEKSVFKPVSSKTSSGMIKKKKKKKPKEREFPLVKSESHQITEGYALGDSMESAPTSLKVQLPTQQKRPNDLHITSVLAANEDTTMDAETVSSMLKELMNPLPSNLVTPIPTPIITRPFVFPSTASQLATVSQAPSHSPAPRLCSTSSEEESENREALATAISTLDNNLAAVSDHTLSHDAPPTHQWTGSVSSSGNSSSDESSSDSGSDSESEMVPLLSLPATTITPIKQTPPHKLTDLVISPLALDESANLYPAQSNSISSQSTVGQSSVSLNSVQEPPPEQIISTHPAANDCEVSDSDSSSGSSSDSGSESDSESSDSEEQASDVEARPAPGQSNNALRTNLNMSQSLEEGVAFDSSGDFTDFFAGLDSVQLPSSLPITSHTTYPLIGTDSARLHTISSNHDSLLSSSTLQDPVLSLSTGESAPRGKRKEPSSQKTARKAPKLTTKENATTLHALVQEDHSPLPKRTISITSSEYHSEEGEVSSEPEDQSIFPSQPVPTSTNQITQPSYVGTQSSQPTTSQLSTVKERVGSLIVRFPLADLKRTPDQNKPKATVEPYNIRQTSDSRVRSRPPETDQVSDSRAPGRRERSEGRGRDGYGSVSGGRHRDEYGPPYHRPRSRRDGNRWERESSRDRRYPPDDRSGRPSGRGWDRGEYIHGDDYWTDDHSDYGGERSRGRRGGYGVESQNYPERYMSEARRKKHEADKIQPPGAGKAKAYMDSVVLFMKYGDATEQQSESSTNSAPKKSSAFRTYNETLAMIKYCQNMANDCKPLVILCMRCQSVLLWRMYLIKLPTAAATQKELQEYFIPPKGAQGKSPYPNSSSPLPSPASVGSTTSTGSGGWASTQDPSPSGSVTVPKHIVNKATEHLTISNYVSHSVELWKSSETLMYQCRDYFSRDDRSAGQRLGHCSPVSQVANWTEKVLRNFRYNSY